jgi:lysozyme
MTDHARGIDVSQWQTEAFPFHRAAEAGYSFAYLRASVRTKPDPCYHFNRARAIYAGLLTGSYHYLYPTPWPKSQALAFFEIARAQDTQLDQLPPALDVEENELAESHILDFVGTWLAITNAPLAIYTSRRKWRQIVGAFAEWPASHPLWVADWRGNDEPAIPCPWQHWTFWQWTSKGSIPGYPGPVDLNCYNGTARQLKKKYPKLWT